MPLQTQFQAVIGSIVIGGLMLFTWTIFNRIFYSKKIWYIRLVFETFLFLFLAYIYYSFLSYFTSGIFNIFYYLALIVGGLIYLKFYAAPFETFFESIAKSVENIIVKTIRLKIKKINDRLKLKLRKKKRKRHGKSKIKKIQSPN